MSFSDSSFLFENAVNKLLKANTCIESQGNRYIVVKQLVRNRSSVIGVLRPSVVLPDGTYQYSDELVACKVFESCTEGIKEEMMARSLANSGLIPAIIDSFFYVPPSDLHRGCQGQDDDSPQTDLREASCSGSESGRESPPYGVHVNVMAFQSTTIRRLFTRVSRALSLSVTSQLTEGLLKCVTYLHANCIVHGDINPTNIFIDADGTVLVGDFGAAYRHPLLSADVETPTVRYHWPTQREEASIDTILNSSRGDTRAAVWNRSPSTSPDRSVCSAIAENKRPYLGCITAVPPESVLWVLECVRNSAKNQILRRIIRRRVEDESDRRSFLFKLRYAHRTRSRLPTCLAQNKYAQCSDAEMVGARRIIIDRAPPLASSHEDASSMYSIEDPDGLESDTLAQNEAPEMLGDHVNEETALPTAIDFSSRISEPSGDVHLASPKTDCMDSDSDSVFDKNQNLDYLDLCYLLGDPTVRYHLLTGANGEYAPEPAVDIWQIGFTVLEMVLGWSVLQLVDMFGEEEQSDRESVEIEARKSEDPSEKMEGNVQGSRANADVQPEKPGMRAVMSITEQLEMITSEWFAQDLVRHLQAEKRITASCADFILLCLTSDPNQRPSAASLLKHSFITQNNKLVDRDKIVTEHLKCKNDDQYLAKILQILQKIIRKKRGAIHSESAGPADKLLQIFRNLSNVLKKTSSMPVTPLLPIGNSESTDQPIQDPTKDAASINRTIDVVDETAGGWLVPNDGLPKFGL